MSEPNDNSRPDRHGFAEAAVPFEASGQDDDFVVTPEIAAAIERARRDFAEGRVLTPEQLRSNLDDLFASWKAEKGMRS